MAGASAVVDSALPLSASLALSESPPLSVGAAVVTTADTASSEEDVSSPPPQAPANNANTASTRTISRSRTFIELLPPLEPPSGGTDVTTPPVGIG